ncbi:ATP-dependent helicase/nuclease subunit A [Halobiforma haloterrestris]|uniref:DNA 3'-5' helicase n=1 Tax=Natronobacterium haloterrestre TaxID=148448 RepID=A0A1I1KBR3_NATHA|nr:UvrD-helicase domain-containing protein [Halobiforma haloterrestris]SFC58196.1 ATP-dependent helicase/nuclease subunit A [Halobiforma haloterrestris]
MSEPNDDPIRLKGAQREIRGAYFDNETGLFTLNCVPGSGKSVVAHHLAAEDVLRRYVAGSPTPEQHVAVISFNRDEAAAIVPEICDRLRTIVEHELVPAATDVSDDELEYLIQRVRQAPYVGTIDSLLRGVLVEIASDAGFEEVPAIGNEALLTQVHVECYETLRDEPQYSTRLEQLEAAYPDGEYDDSVAEMLVRAVEYCRDQQLTTSAFRSELELTRESVYAEGEPEAFRDVVAAVERCVDDESIGERVREAVEGEDRDRVVEADRTLYEAWCARIDDFCTVLSAYRDAYREAIREHGVVSHTDVAFLVARYFDDAADATASLEVFDEIDERHRERILQRHRARLRSVIIDEAQDVSAIQHAALAHLVTPETRVCAVGDALQGIYLWRHADPSWFETATTSGTYLGIDWDTHENRTATTTYRCVPDVATAINSISEPVFSDPSRGDLGTLDTTFSPLEAARDGSDETAVHISSFTGVGTPGSADWANPGDGVGEANILATHLSQGLVDGTFADDTGTPLGITVLFRKRARMSDYEAAFAAEGLRVRNASESLFDCPAVSTVFDVCDWLVQPGSPDRTRTLITESALGIGTLEGAFSDHDWRLNGVLGDDDIQSDLTEAQRRTLTGLVHLRDQRDTSEMRPAGAYVEDVVEALSLRADSNGYFTDTDSEQRVANLDALVETIAQWVGDDHSTLDDLIELVAPFREEPDDGPPQPSTAGSEYDVEFQTAHRSKGDQDDVVVIADPGFDLWAPGPHNQRFIAQGSIVGLAPPENVNLPEEITIPPFEGGLFDPANSWDRDAGLRWVSALWCDLVTDSAGRDGLVGTERLCQVARNERAEGWRLLYVALTRARDHLVIPLPRSVLTTDRHRDRWLDTIRDELNYQGGTDSYTLSVPDTDPNGDSIEIGVNDVDLFARRSDVREPTPDTDVAVSQPRRDRLDPWIPRFVNPSTMYPLTEGQDEYLIAHLLGDSLHTETNDVPDDLPLEFDRLGPGEVGTCLHDVLTELVECDVPENSLRRMNDDVRRVFDEKVKEMAPKIGSDEREGLWAFFAVVLDDFLASDLWERIRDPQTITTVEQPIDGLSTIDGVEIEIHGEADFVVELPSGERHVTDVKITLTDQTPETRHRYELQVAAYSYLFEQQECSTKPVNRAVETFGVERDTIKSGWPSEIIERRLASLVRQ